MLINAIELSRIIARDKDLFYSIFSSRSDDFVSNFKILTQILNDEKKSQAFDRWPIYTIFKSSQSLLSDDELNYLEEDIVKVHKIFGDLSLKEIELKIFKSLDSNDLDGLIECKDDIQSYLFGMNSFPENLMEIIKNLFINKNFLSAEGSWHILMILFYEHEEISSEQWNGLLPCIEQSYYKFKDWMSCFALTEIIGDKFPTIESFNTLMKLGKNEDEDELRRSYIPNALEGFVRYSSNQELRKEAYKNLIDMLSDSSNMVVNESLRSFKSIESIAVETGWA